MINSVFATPFYRTLTGSEALALSLRSVILEAETEINKKKDSPQREHAYVFESNFDFFKWQNETISALANLVYQQLAGVVQNSSNLSVDQIKQLNFESDSWFHVTRSGGYFQAHSHPMASWSVIYCVDPGDVNPKNESAAGHIRFYDPRAGAAMYLDAANRNYRREYSFNALRIRPKPAELFIFPSHLLHAVEPYEGDRERITVAANFWFK